VVKVNKLKSVWVKKWGYVRKKNQNSKAKSQIKKSLSPYFSKIVFPIVSKKLLSKMIFKFLNTIFNLLTF